MYGIWGDTNGDDGPLPMVGEASISLATACYGPESVTGNNAPDVNDVLYIAFRGRDAVPGTSANWLATSFDDFEKSIAALGDSLVAKLSSGGEFQQGENKKHRARWHPGARLHCPAFVDLFPSSCPRLQRVWRPVNIPSSVPALFDCCTRAAECRGGISHVVISDHTVGRIFARDWTTFFSVISGHTYGRHLRLEACIFQRVAYCEAWQHT